MAAIGVFSARADGATTIALGMGLTGVITEATLRLSAREAIFDSAGITFTIDLLNKFLQFDVTKSWSAAACSAPVRRLRRVVLPALV